MESAIKKLPGKQLSGKVEMLSMAARLAKVTLNDMQCEFMFRISELLIEKGTDTSIGEIIKLKEQVEADITRRNDENKLMLSLSEGKMKGGRKKTYAEANIKRIREEIEG